MPVNNEDMICIRLGNFSYCWNFKTCQVEIYFRRIGTINDCPKEIANELMQRINERIEKIKEKAKKETTNG